MKTKFIPTLLILSLSILSGCATKAPSPPIELSNPSAEDRVILEQLTAASLKDPDSARFSGNIVIVNGKSACVEVNAKNSFGGYTGFQQAMLVKFSGSSVWTFLTVKDISQELCIYALNKKVNKNT